MGICRNLRDTYSFHMRFSRIEKGIYFRVDSVDKGDSPKSASEECAEVTVIQYISSFKEKQE